MRSPVFPGGKPPVPCAGSHLNRTTGSKYIWGCIEVRSSHVVSVGRCWPARDTGGIIPSLAWKVKLLHALYVESLLLVLSPCTTTTRPNMGLILWCHQAVLNAHFVAKSSKSKTHGQSTSHIVLITLTERGLIIVGSLGVLWQTTPSPGFATLTTIWQPFMGGRRGRRKNILDRLADPLPFGV